MHPDYFLLTGGLERALYRIARKHVGAQRGGWVCRSERLREKSGSDSPLKEFNRLLKKVVERDALPEFTLASVVTKDGAAAVHFRRRGQAERDADLEEKDIEAAMSAEEERHRRLEAEDRRAREVDAKMDRLAGRRG